MNKSLVADSETKVVTFRLTESELNDLDDLAKQESRSRSSLLVLLVKLAIGSARETKTPIFFANDYSSVKLNSIQEISTAERHDN